MFPEVALSATAQHPPSEWTAVDPLSALAAMALVATGWFGRDIHRNLVTGNWPAVLERMSYNEAVGPGLRARQWQVTLNFPLFRLAWSWISMENSGAVADSEIRLYEHKVAEKIAEWHSMTTVEVRQEDEPVVRRVKSAWSIALTWRGGKHGQNSGGGAMTLMRRSLPHPF